MLNVCMSVKYRSQGFLYFKRAEHLKEHSGHAGIQPWISTPHPHPAYQVSVIQVCKSRESSHSLAQLKTGHKSMVVKIQSVIAGVVTSVDVSIKSPNKTEKREKVAECTFMLRYILVQRTGVIL